MTIKQCDRAETNKQFVFICKKQTKKTPVWPQIIP